MLINAFCIRPDGALWLVDAGSPGVGKPAVHDAARLFRIAVMEAMGPRLSETP